MKIKQNTASVKGIKPFPLQKDILKFRKLIKVLCANQPKSFVGTEK